MSSIAFPALIAALIAISSSGILFVMGIVIKWIPYVVSSGFNVQTTPRTINGTVITPMIPSIVVN